MFGLSCHTMHTHRGRDRRVFSYLKCKNWDYVHFTAMSFIRLFVYTDTHCTVSVVDRSLYVFAQSGSKTKKSGNKYAENVCAACVCACVLFVCLFASSFVPL